MYRLLSSIKLANLLVFLLLVITIQRAAFDISVSFVGKSS